MSYDCYIQGIGTDPEFFVKKKGTDEIVSFSGVFNFTKENPLRVRHDKVSDGQPHNDYLFSEDNVAAEVAIPPAFDVDNLKRNINLGLEKLREILDSYSLEIAPGNAHIFSDEELSKGNAWRFGCDPDFCIYKLKMLKPPPLEHLKKIGMQNLRTTGGHIHIGLSNGTVDKIKFARIVDYLIGKWTLEHEPALPRRILYGRAGAIRLKSYGIEYRTPGNFWVLDEAKIAEVWDLCALALRTYYDQRGSLYKTIMESIQDTKDTVNGKPREKAEVA